MKRLLLTSGALLAMPMVAAAQGGNAFSILDGLLDIVQNIVNALIPIVFGLAVVAFFWGLVKYIFNQADDEKEKGRNLMIWGTIALAVMASIWGIVALLQNTFGVTGETQQPVPTIIDQN